VAIKGGEPDILYAHATDPGVSKSAADVEDCHERVRGVEELVEASLWTPVYVRLKEEGIVTVAGEARKGLPVPRKATVGTPPAVLTTPELTIIG
jgi:hypothetical protein